jgi:hypothetical protein
MTERFSGQVVACRSSPTVLADTLMPGSTSTGILFGKPPRASWSPAALFGLYRMNSSLSFLKQPSYDFSPAPAIINSAKM